MSRTAVDPRLVHALQRQHRHRRALLTSGATHVGWKIGDGERERIGGQVVIGYVTSNSLHRTGGVFKESMEEPKAEVEVAVQLGAPIKLGDRAPAIWSAIAGFRTALEICDTARPREDDAELIVEQNVFHNGLALGPTERAAPHGEASIYINGTRVETAPIDETSSACFAGPPCSWTLSIFIWRQATSSSRAAWCTCRSVPATT